MIDEIDISLTELTQSAFFAFGRAVLDLLWFALFPRVARKKRKQMIVKYHAAAGEKTFVCDTS
jgi:hypothetical protein